MHDASEEIAEITWTVYGKVKEVKRIQGSLKPGLEFMHDASGNRVIKITKPDPADTDSWKYTYYLRDAQGNVMAVYEKVNDGANDIFTLAERNIYGSSRLGIDKNTYNFTAPPAQTNFYQRHLGQKLYEGNNHLGNVLAVFTDRKTPVSNGSGQISHYVADVRNSYDYYPFGSPMPERVFSTAQHCTIPEWWEQVTRVES